MNHLTNSLRLLPALSALLILTGCLGSRPDPSRYYVLGDGTTPGETAPPDCKKTVLVGPVTLAGYLNNPKIARRIGGNEIVYSEWNFWAAPLARSVPRELVASLAKALPDACVFSYRKASPDRDTVQLEVMLNRFEMTDGGDVVVEAGWNTLSNDGKSRRQGNARITRPYQTGPDEFVSGTKALTEALDELAKKIAADLR